MCCSKLDRLYKKQLSNRKEIFFYNKTWNQTKVTKRKKECFFCKNFQNWTIISDLPEAPDFRIVLPGVDGVNLVLLRH